MPEPTIHSIHSSATSSAHGNAAGGSVTLAMPGRCARVWCTTSSRTSRRYSSEGRPASFSRRFSRRIRVVSAAPIDTFSRSLCSGAQAGSMPNAWQ